MTATDELRRMLDERGVEWFESVTREGLTWIYRDGKAIRFHPWQPDTLKVSMFDLTPEQAIAATLGSCNCTNSERTDAPRLPHFWTHDGVLHIEATRMPTRIVVCEGGTCEFAPKRELDVSEAENAKLRELVSRAWGLFLKHGAVHPCDLLEVDAVRDEMRELGIEMEP